MFKNRFEKFQFFKKQGLFNFIKFSNVIKIFMNQSWRGGEKYV